MQNFNGLQPSHRSLWTFLSQVIQHMTDDLSHFSDVAAKAEEEEATESAREEAWNCHQLQSAWSFWFWEEIP